MDEEAAARIEKLLLAVHNELEYIKDKLDMRRDDTASHDFRRNGKTARRRGFVDMEATPRNGRV